MKSINEGNIPLVRIQEDFLAQKNIQIYLLREDLTHPEISGNKWRKLKYNLQLAKADGFHQLLTFGGMYSNHIAACAAAGRDFGFKTIGVLRGEETLPLNPTLQHAHQNGMVFKYISRGLYQGDNKYKPDFLNGLEKEFGKFYLVPEGGSNAYAVKGCAEITKGIDIDYDIVCCACGTGGTLAGIIAGNHASKKIIGFPALKGGDFLVDEIRRLLDEYAQTFNCTVNNNNWSLVTDYHFGGFAKINESLVEFIRNFKSKHDILLDFIYTGKMLYGLYDLIENSNRYDHKKIIVVHTGGLQGNKGFEERFKLTI
jgi:1-aminocyclopropane-1-carboxylate deaminase/D-cysteine desulfhydrase-like pyridoxal-dependent ACC family enzyme